MTRSNALNFTSLRSTLYVHMLTIPGPWLCLFQKWPPPLWRAQEFEYVAKMWAKWNTKRLNQFKKLFIWPLMWCKSVLGQLASKLLTKHPPEDLWHWDRYTWHIREAWENLNDGGMNFKGASLTLKLYASLLLKTTKNCAQFLFVYDNFTKLWKVIS